MSGNSNFEASKKTAIKFEIFAKSTVDVTIVKKNFNVYHYISKKKEVSDKTLLSVFQA